NDVGVSQGRSGEEKSPNGKNSDNNEGHNHCNEKAALPSRARPLSNGENRGDTLANNVRCRLVGFSDGSDKAVSAARNGLKEHRAIGVIAKGFAQTLYRRVDAVLELDHRATGPKALLNLFTGYGTARLLQQQFQKLERLANDTALVSVAGNVPTLEIDF